MVLHYFHQRLFLVVVCFLLEWCSQQIFVSGSIMKYGNLLKVKKDCLSFINWKVRKPYTKLRKDELVIFLRTTKDCAYVISHYGICYVSLHCVEVM
jgi:hypothetical protein